MAQNVGASPSAKEAGQDMALGAFAILIFLAGLPACPKIAAASGLARAARSIASLQRHGGERIWAMSHHGYPGRAEVCGLRGEGAGPFHGGESRDIRALLLDVTVSLPPA